MGLGKSNLISLFQFLQEGVNGSGTDDQRGRTSFEDAVFSLGGARILDGSLDTPANVGLEYQFAIDEKETTLGIELLVQDFHRPVIIEREFLDSGRGLIQPSCLLYRVHSGGNGGKWLRWCFRLGLSTLPEANKEESPTHTETIRETFQSMKLALSAMPRLLENSHFHRAVPAVKPPRKIIDSSFNWKFYNANNMDLERIRLSEPKLGQSDFYVSPSGDNLALVLYNLIQVDFEFEELLNRMIKDILPLTRKLRAVPAGRFSLAIEWHVEGCQEPFFLYEMSDGTVRMLCWAVILHSPKLPSLIVIDEPELGIHPAWMPILAEWSRSSAENAGHCDYT